MDMSMNLTAVVISHERVYLPFYNLNNNSESAGMENKLLDGMA